MTSEGEFDHGKREYYFLGFYLVSEGISGKWLRFECSGLGSCVPKLAKGFEQPGKGRTSKIEVLWEVHLGTSRCGKCDKKVRLFYKHFYGVLRPQKAHNVCINTI